MQYLASQCLRLVTAVAFVATGAAATAADPDEENERVTPNSVSPDGRWECRRTEFDEAAADNEGDCAVVKAGTAEPVVKLPSYIGNVDRDEVCTVLWAPDSQRFAYNYRAGGRYETTSVYQLRDGQWEELRSLEADETSKPLNRAQTAQLRKHKLPVDTHRRRIWDTWEVTRWADARTAMLYVYSNEAVTTKDGEGDMVDLAAHFLFTIRFDERGNWRVIKSHQMSAKEVEARNAASDGDNTLEE